MERLYRTDRSNRKKQLDKQNYVWGTPVSGPLKPFKFDPTRPEWGTCGLCHNETNDSPCASDDCYDRYQYYTCSKCPLFNGRKPVYILCKNNHRNYSSASYSSQPSDVCCTPYEAHLIDIIDLIEDVETEDNVPQHIHAMFMDDQYKPYNDRNRWEQFETTVGKSKKYRTNDSNGYNDGLVSVPAPLEGKAHYFVGHCSNSNCWKLRLGKIWQ